MRFFLVILLAGFSINSLAYNNYVATNNLVPASQLLKCEKFSWYEKAICEEVARKISGILKRQNILFSSNQLIQKVSPVIPLKQVNTGKSCSHKAWINHNEAYFRFSTENKIKISGDMISKPFAVAAESLPVSLYVRVNAKEEFGQKYYTVNCKWAKCRKKRKCAFLASDTWHADLNVQKDVKFLISLDMQPTYGVTDKGDHFIKIKPVAIVNIGMDLDDKDIKFRLYGKSSVLGFFGSILRSASSMTNLFSDWASGSSLKAAFKESGLGIDFLYNTFSVIDFGFSLINQNDRLYDLLVKYYLDKRPPTGIENIDRVLENNLNNNISSALKLDANGERVWVVGKNRPLEKLSSTLVVVNSLNL